MLPPNAISRDRLAEAVREKTQRGAEGVSEGRTIASGEGWRAVDVICTYGPRDHPFEERFLTASISIVLSGSFVCRTARGTNLLSPGALMLGNTGVQYECSHQYCEGDRCLSFQFAPDLFERIARDAGAKRAWFDCDRLPPLRELASLNARASIAANVTSAAEANFVEEIALELAGAVIPLVSGAKERIALDHPRDGEKIAHVLRHMENCSEQPLSIAHLARKVQLSRFHFLRTFKQTTGITPHQWLLRTRLRKAAERLASTREPVTDIALDIGFDDLSNFIRSFRAEFGVSPRRYRALGRSRKP